MKKNIATVDRIIRVIIAIVFAVLYFGKIVPATIGLALFVVGIVFVLTSLIGYCPIYGILGMSTLKKKS